MIGRKFFIAALSCMISCASVQAAESYPTKPIKLVLGFGPGGGADAIARLYASELHKVLGTPVIVENKASAYEQVAGRDVQGSKPDGYTIWMSTTGGLIQAPLMRDMPYSPAKDFTHVGVIAEADAVFAVKNDLPIKSMDELIVYARANPNKLNFGSAGTGAPSHLLVEYIQSMTGVKFTHIPYKSAADAAAAVVSGNVDFAVIVPANSAPLINAGRIRGIAVTAKERLRALPGVPTLEEGTLDELKNMSVYAFYAIVAPKGLSDQVTETLNTALNKVSSSEAIRKHAEQMHFRPVQSSPQDLTSRMENETEIWSKVAQRIK